jgi:hypothetical protein
LIKPWHGPYRVVACANPNTYRVVPLADPQARPLLVHGDRLKAYHVRQLVPPVVPDPEQFTENLRDPPGGELQAVPVPDEREHPAPEVPAGERRREPTEDERARVGHVFTDPGDQERYCTTGVEYNAPTRATVYAYRLLRPRRADNSYTTLTGREHLAEVEAWLVQTPEHVRLRTAIRGHTATVPATATTAPATTTATPTTATPTPTGASAPASQQHHEGLPGARVWLGGVECEVGWW